MKNIIVIVCCILCLGLYANAQLRIGFTAGMKSPTLNTKNIVAEFSEKNRISGGLILDYQFHTDLMFNLKVMYEEIQTNIKAPESAEQYYVESSFLEVPVSFQYKLGEQIAPYIFAGISLHYNLNSDIDLVVNSTKIRGDFSERIKDLSYSLFCGAGLQLNFEKYIIFVEGIYSFGLSNMLIPGNFEMRWSEIRSSIQFNEAASIKYNTLNILTGIKIPVKL